jgi:hypothetical protein
MSAVWGKPEAVSGERTDAIGPTTDLLLFSSVILVAAHNAPFNLI